MESSGDILSSWELGRRYGVADADGRRPDWGAHAAAKVVPSMKWLRDGYERQVDWLERQARRARSYLGAV